MRWRREKNMKKTILHGTGMIKRFEKTEVLHGIDIDVYAGDFTVIMGDSVIIGLS